MQANFILLSNGATVEVPDGCDPAAFKRSQERRLRNAQNPKAKTKRKASRSRKASKRTFQASSVLAAATVELVKRVNKQEDTNV